MERLEARRSAVIRFVVDASSMGPLLLDDEVHELIGSLREALALGECIAPGHWPFEVSNMVLMAVRRKRIEPAHARSGLLRIANLGVPIDNHSFANAMDRTFELASLHGLTLYDAAYLELAGRLGLSLFTYDSALIKAAQRDGVETIKT
jgi:predicted nucleic acid-binding protein